MQRAEIRIAGRLDAQWAEWFDGFTLSYPNDQHTLLCGEVTDPAALYGLFAKLRDLGVTILSIDFNPLPTAKSL